MTPQLQDEDDELPEEECDRDLEFEEECDDDDDDDELPEYLSTEPCGISTLLPMGKILCLST